MNFGQRRSGQFFGLTMEQVSPGLYLGHRAVGSWTVTAMFRHHDTFWSGYVVWQMGQVTKAMTAVGSSLTQCGAHLTAIVRSRLETISRLTVSTR